MRQASDAGRGHTLATGLLVAFVAGGAGSGHPLGWPAAGVVAARSARAHPGATCDFGRYRSELGSTPPPAFDSAGGSWTSSYAVGIDAAGDVFGTVSSGGTARVAVWRGGRLHTLVPPPGFTSSYAIASSDRGTVLGAARDRDSRRRVVAECPFLWRDGQIERLTGLPPTTPRHGDAPELVAVNNLGDVAGTFVDTADEAGARRVFLWRGGRWKPLGGTRNELPARDLDLDIVDAEVHAVNDSGVVAGQAKVRVAGRGDAPTQPAAIWHGDTVRLAVPDVSDVGVAYAVNNRGDVVGARRRRRSYQMDPFVWVGRTLDLNPVRRRYARSVAATAVSPRGRWVVSFAGGLIVAGAPGERPCVLVPPPGDPAADVEAVAINDSGLVAGTVRRPRPGTGKSPSDADRYANRAIVWERGVPRLLPLR